MSISYRDAGVDVERGYDAVERYKKHVKSTFNANVLGGLGSFGGFYAIADDKLADPVLVSGTDGVGTKLRYAFLADKHDTIGIDCVAMCVNDVVCQGAKPLFFLDYFAVGKLNPVLAESVVSGVAEGCRQSGCALVGGETAEMPGFYKREEYDIAGFAVGAVERSRLIDNTHARAGDIIVGLASSGAHSNGYSLIRRLFGEDAVTLNTQIYFLDATLAKVLLEPTRIYVKPVLRLVDEFPIHGIAHITGGGFHENLPRMLPKGLGVRIDLQSWTLKCSTRFNT
jgi:phosphoribosylformylglycinamidine cyclo-ligase